MNPPGTGEIRRFFAAIAGRYDLANRLLSLGVDRTWRRRAARLADPRPGERALDICTGTGDLILALQARCPDCACLGLDLTGEMLIPARRKLARRRGAAGVGLVVGDALRLPVRDRAFDLVTIAFGLRNLPDPEQGIGEMARVLRPGGRLVLLEFAPPGGSRWGRLYALYLKHLLPRLGGLITAAGPSYRHLATSVEHFLPPARIRELLVARGLNPAAPRPLTGGIAYLHFGVGPH